MNKKNLIGLVIIFIFLVAGYIFFNSRPDTQFPGYKTMNFKLEGKNYQLLVADTDEKRIKGLMNITKLNNRYDGMIFIFPDKKYRTFWNKNTLMDLDLYWIDGDKVVDTSFLPAITQNELPTTVSSPAEVDKVVELPAGR